MGKRIASLFRFPGPQMGSMKIYSALAVLLIAASTLCAQEAAPSTARPISFPSSGGTLYGFLYVPEGKGPFPAVLWNHGSEKRPGWQPEWPRSTTRMDLCSSCRTGGDRGDHPDLTSWMSFAVAEVPC